MRSHHARILLLVVAIAGYPVRRARAEPQVAAAAPDAASEGARLIEQGLKLREEGRDADALPLFVRASEIHPSPRASAQLALVHQALGNWVAAERGLMNALEAANDPWVVQRRAPLQKALVTVQEQLGWLEVETNLRGAEISIDDGVAGVSPMAAPLRVPAGQVRLRASAAGHVSVLRLVHVVAGERAHESLLLEPERGSIERERTGEEAREEGAAPASNVSTLGDGGVSAPPSAGRSRTLAWLSLGGAATLVGGGVAASVVRESNVAEWNDNARCLKGTATREQTCSQFQSTANTAMTLSIAGYAAGGALAVTSLVLFLRSPREPTTAAHALAPRCGVGVLTVSCEGTF